MSESASADTLRGAALANLGWLNTYQGIIVPGLASAFGTFGLIRSDLVQKLCFFAAEPIRCIIIICHEHAPTFSRNTGRIASERSALRVSLR